MTVSTAYAAAANVNATLNGSTAPGNYTDQSPTTWYPNNVGAWLNNGSGGAVYTDFNNSGNYAQAVFNSKTTNTDSEAICLYNFAANWSTSITSGATISACSGVISRVGGTSTTHGSYYDLCVQLVIYNGSDLTSGLIGSNQAAASAAWPNNASPTSNFATASYTFSAPTYSQATNSNFGVAFGVDGSKTTNTLSAYVNYVQLSVTWTGSSPPGPPDSLALSYISPTSLGATWTNPDGSLTDSKVRISTDNLTWTTTDIGSVATSYTFTGLTPNTLYYVQVAESNSSGTTWSPGAYLPTEVTISQSITLKTATNDILTTGYTKVGTDVNFAETLADTNDANYVQTPGNITELLIVQLQNCPANLICVTGVTVNGRGKNISGASSGVLIGFMAAAYYSGTTTAGYLEPGPFKDPLTGSFVSASDVQLYQLQGTQGIADWTGGYLVLNCNDAGIDAISEASITITYLVPAIPIGSLGFNNSIMNSCSMASFH